jgi:hypothetical protein
MVVIAIDWIYMAILEVFTASILQWEI